MHEAKRQHGSGGRSWILATLLVAVAVVVGLGLAASQKGTMHADTGASSGGAPDVQAALDACLAGGSACTVMLVIDGVRHTWVGAGAGAPPVAAGEDVLPCAADADGASSSSSAPRMVAALSY